MSEVDFCSSVRPTQAPSCHWNIHMNDMRLTWSGWKHGAQCFCQLTPIDRPNILFTCTHGGLLSVIHNQNIYSCLNPWQSTIFLTERLSVILDDLFYSFLESHNFLLFQINFNLFNQFTGKLQCLLCDNNAAHLSRHWRKPREKVSLFIVVDFWCW